MPPQVTYDQFRDFLKDPSNFVLQNQNLKTAMRDLSAKFSSNLSIGIKGIEDTNYFGKKISGIGQYQDSKADVIKIYDHVESALGSTVSTVFEMEVANWSGAILPDEDFAKLVQQYFKFIQNFNAFLKSGTKMPGQALEMLRLQVYGSTYELAGKRILRAAEIIENQTMNDLGAAIRRLRARNYNLTYFDIELRNGLFHGNFLIDPATNADVDYGNIYLPRGATSKVITKFRKKLVDIDLLTISLSVRGYCFEAELR